LILLPADWQSRNHQDYGHVIFDTAPTGHTLRLMSLAKAWDQFSATTPAAPPALVTGRSEKQRAFMSTVKTLAEASATTLVLVSRPQLAALNEAERTSGELRALGVGNQQLVINGMFETKCPEDVTSQAIQRRGLAAVESAKEFIGSLPTFIVPLRPINILGLGGLRVLLTAMVKRPVLPKLATEWTAPEMESLEALVADIERQGSGVVMTMGKGGVGKTPWLPPSR
jgi:arsenite-transporting ATPase